MVSPCKPSFLAIVLLSSVACGSSSSNEPPPASHYAGGIAGVGAFSGSFTFDIAAADAFLDSGPAGVVDATGTWIRGGTPVNLFGTYTGSTKLVSLSGSRDSVTYNLVNDPVSAPATRVTGGAFGGGGQGAWVALKVQPQVSVSVLCGSGSGAGLVTLALVLGSDGAASMALQFQTIPTTMVMTRTGDALSGSKFGYTFSGTISATGQNASGTVTDGTTSGTWTAGVNGC